MIESLLADAVEQFLAGRCDLRRVREIETDDSGRGASGLWTELRETGFADALIPEDLGGAGLGMQEAAAIPFASGRHALPVPLALTMSVRASLAEAGLRTPDGAITIACSGIRDTGDGIVADAVPYGLVADWVLLSTASGDLLVSTDDARRSRSGGRGSLSADLHWPAVPGSVIECGDNLAGRPDWMAVAAALVAAQMAGAMERVAAMTIAYANERVQFGRPIARQQAIQQQVSVMAEQCSAARAAALFALSGNAWRIAPLRAAVAKSRVGEAAALVAAIGHAVHGAIGVTDEYDLQMLTRRLHEWRAAYGGQGYWNRRLGHALLDDTLAPLEFVQQRMVCADGTPG